MRQVHFKRIICMLITVAMLMTMVPAALAAVDDFVDFPAGWSKDAMEFSVEQGLLKGKSVDRIEPAANLTRAEMATIINRAFGAKITKDISAYADVKPTDWYYTEMQKAVNMQTFNGDGNGYLRPNDAITREEVMAVIARAMVLEQADYSPLNKYADFAEFADWAKPYAAALVAGGYVNGLGNGKIHPKVSITREEFAQLMYNIFKTYHTKAGTYNTVTPMNCVMINQPGITLENVTVYGDLVLGDGVGDGIVNIKNVTINGRLLARGGNITLTNVTTGGGVVVKNVNGVTHFNNYKSESVFKGVVEHTQTTYKKNGSYSSSGHSYTEYYDITFYVNAKDSILCKTVGTMTNIAEGSTLADDVVDAFYTSKGYPLSELAIKTDVYKEPVEPELWYLNDKDEWTLFTSDTKIVSDMEIYAMVKFSSLSFDLNPIGIDEKLILKVPYSTERRLMHSFKDSMLYNRNKVVNAMNMTDAQSKVYSKIASSTGLIDNEGYFIVKHYSFDIPEVIRTVDFEGEVRGYVEKVLMSNDDKSIGELIDLSNFTLSGMSRQEILDEIASATQNKIDEYVDYICNHIFDSDGYKDFIKDYADGKSSYDVNNTNILYMLGAAHGVEQRNFEEALKLLGDDSISKAVSKLKSQFPAVYAELEDSYNSANQKFCNDIIAIRDEIKTDSTYSQTYSLSLSMKINTAKLVELLYNDVSDRLKAKLTGAPYYYNDNTSLKKFVEMNLFEQLVYPYDSSVANDVNSGYQLKPFIDYNDDVMFNNSCLYDVMFNNLCLFDDAMLWYGTVLTDDQYEQFKKDFAEDLMFKLQSISDILSGLDDDGTIRGYTIDDIINKVESLKSAGDIFGSYGSQIEDIINRICDILEDTKQGRPVVKGYTIDDLADVCDKLSEAVEMLSKEEYEALNKKFENAVNKAIVKLDEIITELDKNGTILGRPIEDLVTKIDFINNFYSKHKDKIDKIIDLFADFDSDSAKIEADIQRWENALFGKDIDDRFSIDDLFEVIMPVIDQYKVDNPNAVDGTIVIDEYTIGNDAAGITANRYFQ